MTRDRSLEEERFRRIFRKLHADHDACIGDEWLERPCTVDGETCDRPISFSRRNGPWHQVDVVWIGAAPGNAGGRGSGDMGAHATRIPFGGDIAGGNFDVLLASAGLDRNSTFIVAALNELPAAGGGEPSFAEMAAPKGAYESSVHVVRDTLIAAGPRLIVALGNVGLRAAVGAAALDGELRRLPSIDRIRKGGIERNVAVPWPATEPPSTAFMAEWRDAWGDAPLPCIVWLTHPSAQNMSPYAGVVTVFHRRMLDTRKALCTAVETTLGRTSPERRPPVPLAGDGVYGTLEWREKVGPRHAAMDALWREKGV